MELGLFVAFVVSLLVGVVLFKRSKKRPETPTSQDVGGGSSHELVQAHALKEVKVPKAPAKKKPGRKPTVAKKSKKT